MGGGGKGGSSTQTVTIPPEVLARYNAVNARAEGVAATPFKKYSDDPNAFVAALTPTQQSGIANTNAAAGMAQPYYQTATQGLMGAQRQATGAINQAYGDVGAAQNVGTDYGKAATNYTYAGGQAVNAGDLQTDKYFDPFARTVAGTTYAALQQQQGQDRARLAGQQAASGAFGNDRTGLERANLARQQTLGTAQAITPIMSQAYQNAQQTAQQQQGVGLSAAQANRAALASTGQQLAGLGQQQFGQGMTAAQQRAALGNQAFGMGATSAQQLAALGTGAQAAGLQGAQAQLAAGQIQQQTEQAGKAAKYNQFLQEQGYPFQVAQFLANIAEGTGALSGSTTSTSQASDERLKENIKKIGETNDGQPIYKYNFKGSPTTEIGLLAQNVEKKHPDAVGKAPEGYKTVDYDKATESSEGGSVHPSNARQGFALGGSDAFDPNMVKEILRRQVEMYQQQGTPGGGKSPGAAGYMPAPQQLPANLSIARPAAPPPKQPSGIAEAAQTGRNISEGLGMAESAKNKLFGGTDAKGKPVAGWLDRSDEANKLRDAQEAIAKKARDEIIAAGQAHGGLVTDRHGYALGGLPYGSEDAVKKGYMGQISYDMPTPIQLKNQQDAMRTGKLADSPQSGLGEAAGAASKLYSTGKMASAAYDKAADMLSGATPAGELATKYPAAPAGTPMPPVRPEGLGGAGAAPAAEIPTASATPISHTAAANTAEGFHIPMGANTAATTAPVTEGLGAAAAPIAETATAAAPIAESLAAAAPIAEGLAAAAPVAEIGAGLAAAAPVAEAGVAAAELLPLLFAFSDKRLKENIKKVGETNDGQNIYKYNFKGDHVTRMGLLAQEVAHDHPDAVGKRNGYLTVDYDKATSGREHHAGNEGNVVGESATPVFDELRRMREKEEAAAAEAPAPEKRTLGAYKRASEVATGNDVYDQLHPEFGPKFRQFIEEANRQGIPIKPGSLYRTPQEQAGLVADKAANRRGQYQGLPVANPYESAHNYALAGDFAGYKPEYRGKLGEIAKGIPGMVYGGDFNDPLHVQLGRNHGQLKSVAYDESGKFNREFKLPEGFLSGDQATAYVSQQGGPEVAKDAFKGVKDLPDTVKSGLGSAKQTLSDAGDYYTSNREHIIPILSGLGTLLASSKPTRGQAIGEGLAGYAASAGDMMKRAADVENVRQTTTTMQNQDVRASLVTVGGINGVFIKGGKFIPFDEYDRMPNKPDLLGYRPSEGSEEYKAAQAEMEARKSGQPATAQPSTGLAATPAPLAPQIDDQSLKLAQEAKGEFNRGTNQSAAAREATKNYGNATQARGYIASQNQNQILELAELINKAGQQTGLGVPGSLYGPRMELLRGVNTIAGGLSAPPVSEAPQIAKQINKITTNLTDVGSPETLGQFKENKAALASGELDPDSAANVMADLMVRNRMAIDQDEHKEAFRQYSGGNLAPAQRDFDRKYSVARQDVEKRAIAELIKTNPDNLLQKLRDMPAAEIDKLFSKKDPRLVNMSRYFVGRQQ